MRVAVRLSLALVLAAGCSAASGEDLSAEGGDRDEDDGTGDGAGGGGAPAALECDLASDCVPAGSTCCECPAFAVPVGSGYDEACSEVACDPAPTGCALTEPACVEGRCQLVCSTVVTEMACEDGFARDDFGCLLDACDLAGQPECDGDDDCVQVPADCCGCAGGGSDTAVPTGSEAQYEEGLDCPADPSCPGVDVCDPDSEPRCIVGTCQLVSTSGSGDGGGSLLCGTADSPPCPEGTVCVLNHPDAPDATQVGAGSCQNP
ncbi:MAG TPA: hypothetical protein VFU21_10970 [Kofleriaceae bacterium]|nr:hypothetical protein [Kofleriaceae bacterium]